MNNGQLPISQRIPFCTLIQTRIGEGDVIIGDTRKSFGELDYGKLGFVGLENVTIKYNIGSIICDVTFPIHQDMMNKSELNENSDVHKIFTLLNTWKIKFGWGGQSPQILSGMKLSKWSLDYDAQKRVFMAKLSLVPANGYVLGDIKMLMLKDVIDRLKSEIKPTPYSGKKPINISLADVVTLVLNNARDVINDHSKLKNVAPNVGFVSPVYDAASSDSREWIRDASRSNKKWNDLNDNGIYASNVFLYATPEDIPDPDEIVLILFAENAFDLQKYYKAFHEDGILDSNVLDKLTDESNKDLNAFQFLSMLLSDNGFTIMPRPGSRDSNGRIIWMILQTDFNNISMSIEESEFIGIGKSNSVSLKIIQTFGSRDGSQNKGIFDLHSNENIVLSVNASTDQGSTTLASYYATENLIGGANNIDGGENITEYRNSIYKILANESKKLDLETIGFPQLNPLDNIIVNLGGELYSGRYKVMEITHNIGSTFTSNIYATRSSKGIQQKTDDIEPIESPKSLMENVMTSFSESATEFERITGDRLVPFGPK